MFRTRPLFASLRALTFDAAGVDAGSTSGQLTGSRDPRIMQLALRLTF